VIKGEPKKGSPKDSRQPHDQPQTKDAADHDVSRCPDGRPGQASPSEGLAQPMLRAFARLADEHLVGSTLPLMTFG
jgi:hypothetical protein